VKTLEVQRRWTRGRKGSGTVGQPITEQERSVSAPAKLAQGRQPCGATVRGSVYKRQTREGTER